MNGHRSWPELTTRLIHGQDLSVADAYWAMAQVMSGSTSPIQLAGFLTALATKGETSDEILGLANAMQANAEQINLDTDALDIVGTGGDRFRTVNISTMASLVIASGGVKVVKHGNRASSSASGSADCFEALGVDLNLSTTAVEKVFKELGITFLFANKFHPSMKYAAQARRELAVMTAFNVLGPLTNPARPQAAAIGVSHARLAPIVAEVLAMRKTRALVFRGENGLDELSAVVPNQVWEVRLGEVTYSDVDAVKDLGFKKASIEDLRGGDPQFNAKVANEIFDGARGPVRDAVVLNAAGAFVADGTVAGMRPEEGTLLQRLANAVEYAESLLDKGAPKDLLAQWVGLSHQLK
ncbi:MAG: anthranilate phosphoribosyltransferase [Actinomycetaceae bacterium]|nr:anthranilate phosphoribosyltransferase [Actinomycetaceae bacterium]